MANWNKNPFEAAGNFFAGAAKAAADTAGKAANGVGKAASGAAGVAANTAGKMASEVEKVAEGASDVARSAFEEATNFVGEAAESISDAAGKAGGAASGAARGLAKNAATVAVFGAQAVSDAAQTKMSNLKKYIYKPVFPDQYNSSGYDLPKMIVIKDEDGRKGIDVCDGAMGWFGKVGDLEILFMYEEWVEMSGLSFYPVAMCESAYYVDPFNSSRYVRMDSYIETMKKDMNAELVGIAHCLGAKKCRLEYAEQVKRTRSFGKHDDSSAKATLIMEGAPVAASFETGNDANGRYTSVGSWKESFFETFEGNAVPCVPELNWYKGDSQISHLINARCNKDLNSSKTFRHEITKTYSSSLAIGLAKKLDTALDKLSISQEIKLETTLKKDLKTKYVFEIEF